MGLTMLHLEQRRGDQEVLRGYKISEIMQILFLKLETYKFSTPFDFKKYHSYSRKMMIFQNA